MFFDEAVASRTVHDEGFVEACQDATIEAAFAVFAEGRAAFSNALKKANTDWAIKLPTARFQILLAEADVILLKDFRKLNL